MVLALTKPVPKEIRKYRCALMNAEFYNKNDLFASPRAIVSELVRGLGNNAVLFKA